MSEAIFCQLPIGGRASFRNGSADGIRCHTTWGFYCPFVCVSFGDYRFWQRCCMRLYPGGKPCSPEVCSLPDFIEKLFRSPEIFFAPFGLRGSCLSTGIIYHVPETESRKKSCELKHTKKPPGVKGTFLLTHIRTAYKKPRVPQNPGNTGRC